jgi:sister-chromatid-cohesion protein PDS5
MAPRRGADVVAEEPQLGGLVFNEPLSWRAGKPIPTGDLLGRLDTLASELREMDQEQTDKDSLTKVAKELAGQNLLGHKDKGVRAFTACCLVDVLKICAPDAPFTPTQLKVCQTKLGEDIANPDDRTYLLFSLRRYYLLSLIPPMHTIRNTNTSWCPSPKSKA